MSTGVSSTGFYVARRLLQAVPLVIGVTIITFVLVHIAPGDPITILAGDGGNAAYYEEMRRRFGLDRPLLEQLLNYLREVAVGQFGFSFRYQQPVFQVVLAHVPATLLLMGTALVFSTIVGIALGVLAAVRPRSWLDHGITTVTSTVDAMPVFWLGQLLMFALAVRLGLFPVQGMRSVRHSYTGMRHVLDVLHHLALPALTLGLAQVALIARLTRTSLRQVLAEEFIRTAHAKGLSRRIVLWRHALRNALLPIVTVIGGHIGVLLTGAALTETIFSWPGLGRLLLDAALNRDYPLLMAIFILVSIMVVLANLLTDIVYMLFDPRVRYG